MPQADEIQELLGRTWAGRYEILEFIGRGGMGLVFKARQIQMDREVALKVVHRQLCLDQKQVQRFQQEARTSSKLNHPNSIRVYDYGTTEDGRLFMAMEFLRGATLGQLLLREGPQHPERVVRIARQMFKSLAEAHQLGLVHRDLKPENIFICDIYGEHDFVKVLDFGIAKAIGPHADGANLTQTGFICGTPRYLSPEQALGQDVDGRADLYSVGVLMYEMLSGRPPFIGENPISIVMKHVHDDPPPLGGLERFGAVGRKLSWLIDRLLEKNPARRPTPADRIVAYLDDHIDESDLMGQPMPDRAPAISPPAAPELQADPLAQRRPTVMGMPATGTPGAGLTQNLAAPSGRGFKDFGAGGAEATRPVSAIYDAVPPPLPPTDDRPPGSQPVAAVSHGAETSLLLPNASLAPGAGPLPPFEEAGDHQHTALIERPASLADASAAQTLVAQDPGEMTRQMSLDEVRSADAEMRGRPAPRPLTAQVRRRPDTQRPQVVTAAVPRGAAAPPRDPLWTWALVGVALSVLLLSVVFWWWSGQAPAGPRAVAEVAPAPAVAAPEAPAPAVEPPVAAPPAVVAAAAAPEAAPTVAAGGLPLPAAEVEPGADEEGAVDLAEEEPAIGAEIGELLGELELPDRLLDTPEPVELAPEPEGSEAAPLYGEAPEPEAAPRKKPRATPRPKAVAKPKPKPRPKRERPTPAPKPAQPAPEFVPF
ncbi:MAG: protein kinase [Deltaproteobacteria bacterium]|nr:protein kinase [Deltaproteobacteria bacterium]MCB9788143.1 protein kinase [Deltaproteobacteria bacterium]